MRGVLARGVAYPAVVSPAAVSPTLSNLKSCVRSHGLTSGVSTLCLRADLFKRGSHMLSGTRHTSGSPELGADRGAREVRRTESDRPMADASCAIRSIGIGLVGARLIEGILA